MTATAASVQAHFEHGVALFQQGRFGDAASYLQHAVQLQPDHVDALTWLANVCIYQHRYDEAISHYRRALQLNPDIFGAHYVLAVALFDQGHYEQAEAHYRHALRLNPHHAEAHNGLGVALMKQERWHEAAACLRQAVQLNPQFADALGNLGMVLHREGNFDDANRCCEQAIRLNPNRAEAHYNWGTVLEQQKMPDRALGCYEQALRINPHYLEARFNLANLLNGQDKRDAAIAHYQEILRLRPDWAEAHSNLGSALAKVGMLEDAMTHYRRALQLKSDYADAHFGLAIALRESGSAAQALASIDEAVRIQPTHGEARWDRALLRLLLGDFERGWPEYEWRWTQHHLAKRLFTQPLWDGADLHGQTILLYAEQGLGDTLQFIRYVPLVKQRGGHVMVECQPALMRLLASVPAIDCLVARGNPLPAFDVQAPLLSLPRIFHTSLASIPTNVPYISADQALVARWQQELAPHRAFKVGIVWQGNPELGSDQRRSIPLTQFAPLGQVKGVELFSLQVGPGTEQLATLPLGRIPNPSDAAGHFDVIDLGSRFDQASFADAAAAILNMDLVVTVDSAIAHLVGALGAPVWVALPLAPDWRWLLERGDSPWYPTMRLFRQNRRDDWEPVFRRMVEELRLLLANLPEDHQP